MRRNIKIILLLFIYITILALQSSLFAIDDFINFKFFMSVVFEKITGQTIQEFIDSSDIYSSIRNNENLNENGKNQIIEVLNENIVSQITRYLNEIYIKLNMGLLKACMTSNINIILTDEEVLNGIEIDNQHIIDVQSKINEKLNDIFRCYNYNGPEFKKIFNNISKILWYVRLVIGILFIFNISIIIILSLKLLSGANLFLFTSIKNIIVFITIFIFVILFLILLFFPLILDVLNINELNKFGIDDFKNKYILQPKNWGISFILLLTIMCVLVVKSVFIDRIKVM